jgi:hypothetical protein
MNRTSFAEAIALLALSAGACSDILAQQWATPDAAARQWLSLIDAGDYVKSWDRAGALFKSSINAHNWEASIAPVRDPLGAIRERNLTGVKLSSTMAGLPDGEYAVAQFNSNFANGAAAVEIVGLNTKDDRWTVIGYFIE